MADLVLIDPGDNDKIWLVKEIRTILHLGLKETMFLVKKPIPVILKKGITVKESREAIRRFAVVGIKCEVHDN